MKPMNCAYLAGSLLLAGVLALNGGCGYKTDPVPPQSVVPKPVTDLRYSFEDEAVRLSWSYPLETISGDDIADNLIFELYRAEMPLENFCGSCPIPFGEPQEIMGGVPDPEKRDTAEHVSGMLRQGNKYFFKVRSRTSWWADSADSNIVSFVYHKPAAAPADLQAETTAAGVVLTWAPVTRLADGSAADLPRRYRVLKSRPGQPWAPASDYLEDNRYVDGDVQSGTTYSYKIESSLLFEGEMIEGSESSPVSVRVVDTAPPPAVTGVTVIASASDYRIFWDHVRADDLAGYRVYRRLEGQERPVRVAELEATRTLFVDTEAPADKKVFYAVAAFDTEGNEGELSKEATTRH